MRGMQGPTFQGDAALGVWRFSHLRPLLNLKRQQRQHRVGVGFLEGRDFYRFTPFCTEGNFYRFMPNSDAHFYRFTHSPRSAEIRM